MHMFSRPEDDGHEVNMDNLYNLVTFARAAYDMEVPQKDGCLLYTSPSPRDRG